jgi:hypothetical protein
VYDLITKKSNPQGERGVDKRDGGLLASSLKGLPRKRLGTLHKEALGHPNDLVCLPTEAAPTALETVLTEDDSFTVFTRLRVKVRRTAKTTRTPVGDATWVQSTALNGALIAQKAYSERLTILPLPTVQLHLLGSQRIAKNVTREPDYRVDILRRAPTFQSEIEGRHHEIRCNQRSDNSRRRRSSHDEETLFLKRSDDEKTLFLKDEFRGIQNYELCAERPERHRDRILFERRVHSIFNFQNLKQITGRSAKQRSQKDQPPTTRHKFTQIQKPTIRRSTKTKEWEPPPPPKNKKKKVIHMYRAT